MSRAAVLVLVLAAALVAAPDAMAEMRFKRCGGIGFGCARVNVPLDRSGTVPGRVPLFVKRLPAQPGSARGATFLLAGGPGQSATDAFSGDGVGIFAPAFRRRQLIVYDQRGTGRSGVLRCPSVERATSNAPGPVAACARRLGARRSFYTTRDSVEDIEAIRRRLGVARIVLVGTSYGTKVALGYALRYPRNVERLVLDSVVEASGPNAYDLDSIAAVPRVLRALCAPGGVAASRAAGRAGAARGCSAFTADPVADVARLVASLAGGPLRGKVYDGRGRAVPQRVTRADVLGILLAGDLDAALRAATPGAVSGALAGDPWPLARLVHRVNATGTTPPARFLSAGLFVATSCEEAALPWPRTTPPIPAQRRALAVTGLATTPDAAFAPFDRATALRSQLISLCGGWPQSSIDPALGPGPLPDVPVLLLAGGQDLRTPLESAQRVAALFPRAQLVTVPRAGHSVLGADATGCASKALRAFFADRPVNGACPPGRAAVPIEAPPPTALGQIEPYRGVPGRAGRAVAALELTIRDVVGSTLAAIVESEGKLDALAGGGLRGGTFRIGRNGITLRRLAYVPGVRVSGRLSNGDRPGRLRISGPGTPAGRLTLEDRRLRGRIGGARVDVRFDPSAGVAAARATATSRPRPPLAH